MSYVECMERGGRGLDEERKKNEGFKKREEKGKNKREEGIEEGEEKEKNRRENEVG